jgi:hypothetical protein
VTLATWLIGICDAVGLDHHRIEQRLPMHDRCAMMPNVALEGGNRAFHAALQIGKIELLTHLVFLFWPKCCGCADR